RTGRPKGQEAGLRLTDPSASIALAREPRRSEELPRLAIHPVALPERHRLCSDVGELLSKFDGPGREVEGAGNGEHRVLPMPDDFDPAWAIRRDDVPAVTI